MTVIHTIKNKICSTITKMINLCFIIPAFEYFIRNPFPFFNRKHMFDTICIIKPEHLFVNRFMIWSLHKGTLRLRFKINRISVYPADTCEWERHWFDPQLNHINFKKTSVEWKTSSQFFTWMLTSYLFTSQTTSNQPFRQICTFAARTVWKGSNLQVSVYLESILTAAYAKLHG